MAWQPTPVFLPGESPWTEEPGKLQSMGSQTVRHDWVTKHNTAHATLWEKWGWIGNHFYPINIRMGDCYNLKWEGMWKGLQQYLAHDRCSMLLSGLLSGSVIKNLPANAGDAGWIRGSGRFPGTGNGNILQYSYLGNPIDRGAWQAT